MHTIVFLLLITLGIYRIAAQCSSWKGDTRVINGWLDEPFYTETLLPGQYDSVVSGIDNVKIVDGNCSTPFFICHITQYLPYKAVARINGTMSFGLKRITFFSSENSPPMNVIFLTNHYWNELASNSIQYQYALPLIVNAANRDTVTLTCSIMMQSSGFELLAGVDQVPYYWSGIISGTTSKVHEHPQIMNFEDRTILFHRVFTLTVVQKYPIDFYTCRVGTNYQTHMIDWNAEIDRSSTPVLTELIGTFIGSNAGFEQDLSGIMERIILSILGDSGCIPNQMPILLLGFFITTTHYF